MSEKLITPVGATLEVVDRAETTEEGGSPDDGIITHLNHQDVYR